MDFSFDQIFDQFNTSESYTILVIILLAFLFGFIIGMLLRGARISRLRRELEALKPQVEAREREVADLQDQLATANEELAEKDKVFEQQQREVVEAEELLLRREQEKNKLYNELQDIHTELEQLQASNRSYLSTIEELNDQILGIRAQREQETEEVQRAEPTYVKSPETGVETLVNSRLERIEAKVTQLEKENLALRKEVNSLYEQSGVAGEEMNVAAATVSSNRESHLPAEESPPAADLQLIEGIDNRIEAHLKASGIRSWEDLAESSADRLRALLQQAPELPQNDPKTWPIQARLALNNDWNLLKEYQQQLLGGHELGDRNE